MITLLTVIYLTCFVGCAVPSIVRVVRRRSSEDLSIWREVLLLSGVTVQLSVFVLVGSPWQVWISPVLSAVSVGTLLAVTYRYRAS